MNNVVFYDRNGVCHDSGIPLSIVSEVDVSVISGDEYIVVLTKTGRIRSLNARDYVRKRGPRVLNGSYIVNCRHLAAWNHRKNSTSWMFEPEFGGSYWEEESC